MKKTLTFSLISVVIFLLGFYVRGLRLKDKIEDPCSEKYVYINPALNCGSKHILVKSNPIALKEKLDDLIEEKISRKEITTASIYFRDLEDGPIFGINEDEEFIGASLLKLPTAITFYRMSEDESSGILTQKLQFKGHIPEEEVLEQYFSPGKTITEGHSYSVEELIYNSLVYSDNLSNEVLKASLKSIKGDDSLILKTYREMGLIGPGEERATNISTRSYATIFRILYNSSYLSIGNSEKILSILSEVEFDKGITAGVPEGTKVANKFGERFVGEDKQLHDCGIVYYPGNPYLLCVMTKGGDFEKLTGMIQEVSKEVYKEIDYRKIR